MSNNTDISKSKRRLPVYFLVDTSESMKGEAIKAVEKGLASLKESLMKDRLSRATVYIALYFFDDDVRSHTADLVPVELFNPPTNLEPAGKTMLSKALKRVHDDIDRQIRRNVINSYGQKGDYRPMVYLLTDGEPSIDDPWPKAKEALIEMRNPQILRYMVAGCGDNISDQNLRLLGGHDVFHFEKDAESFMDFFDWVSQSIQMTSRSVTQGGILSLITMPSTKIRHVVGQ